MSNPNGPEKVSMLYVIRKRQKTSGISCLDSKTGAVESIQRRKADYEA